MDLKYRVIRSERKGIAIQITPGGEMVVRAPKRLSLTAIRQFVESKRGWIESHLAKRSPAQPKLTQAEVKTLARQALDVIPEIVSYYAPLVGVTYGNTTIRNQQTFAGDGKAVAQRNEPYVLFKADGASGGCVEIKVTF